MLTLVLEKERGVWYARRQDTLYFTADPLGRTQVATWLSSERMLPATLQMVLASLRPFVPTGDNVVECLIDLYPLRLQADIEEALSKAAVDQLLEGVNHAES